ncbi:MAG: hypothetical protein AAF585_00870 [Verrucomicrobiota bacterium]
MKIIAHLSFLLLVPAFVFADKPEIDLAKSAEATLKAESNVVVVFAKDVKCEHCASDVFYEVMELPFVDRKRFEYGIDFDKKSKLFTIAVAQGKEVNQAALSKAFEVAKYKMTSLYRLVDGKVKREES